MENYSVIKSLAKQIYPRLVEIRRHMHKYHELSGLEKNTAAFICSVLDEWNISYKSGIGGYGIVAIIEGKAKGPCIALRADMDALNIQEENDCEYKSTNAGVMHACGHDAHVASLLGTAYILNSMKESISGSYKLIFQPSEEKFPGGAIQMIEEGVLENPKVDAIIGQHVLPGLATGSIGLKNGPYMASTDEIYITVTGKGGHGATPELNTDPVVIASQIIIALQQITSRAASPSIHTVLSFGRMIADGRTNIIPNSAIMEGTIRTFDETWRAEAHKKIISIANGIAEGFGARCSIDIRKGYPFLINDDTITNIARNAASGFLGPERVVELPLRMTAEDFAYYVQKIQGVFYRLGITDAETNKPNANLHSADFDIDENALFTGCSTMAIIALNVMSELNNS